LAVTDWRLRRWRLWFLALITATLSGNSLPISGVKVKKNKIQAWTVGCKMAQLMQQRA